MALADAIALIADQMDEDANNAENTASMFTYSLHSYARQLRIAIKAADGGKATPATPMAPVVPELQHFLEIEKAKAELREQRKKANMEEAHDNYSTCVGGESDGLTAPISGMPAGAKTIIGSEVYELKGGKLVFVEAKK